MKKLSIDFEFTSRTWWESGGQALWDAVTEGFDGSGVIVDDDLASFVARASARHTRMGRRRGVRAAPDPLERARRRRDRSRLSADFSHFVRIR
jgi:hypothetical protein